MNARPLSAEDMAKAFELSKGSTSIELKLSIPATGHRATIKSLKLDPVEAQPRQAFFFDTPNLDLFKAGVVVRARRIQGGRGDTVVKLRPVDPDKIDPGASALGELQDRAGRDAGRIRVLGVVQGRVHRQGGARHDRRQDAAQFAVLEGTAGVLRSARSGGPRHGFPGHIGPRIPAQGHAQAEGLR